MTARAITLTLAFALILTPALSHSQQPAKVYRIGYLGVSTAAETDSHHCPIQGIPGGNWQAFMEGLREHGYLPGQNLLVECRWTEGRTERAPALAEELVSLKPDRTSFPWARTILRSTQGDCP